MESKELVEMLVTIDDNLTEVALIVKANRPITEDEFMNAVLDFYQNCTDLDFQNVIGDRKEMDLDLN